MIEQAAEARLAVHPAVAGEIRQREPNARLQPRLAPGEQEALLVGRQQHVEMLRCQQTFDEAQEAARIGAQAGTMVEFAHKARIARQAPARGVADLDVMAGRTQDRDRLAARGAGPL
ncbi:hypothetical protein MTX20_13140 [Bradyrhizobium sp. ISRA435]|nr:hypothetical protein MTX20_13140 [Bradyrhizobium sp. ISRA435]